MIETDWRSIMSGFKRWQLTFVVAMRWGWSLIPASSPVHTYRRKDLGIRSNYLWPQYKFIGESIILKYLKQQSCFVILMKSLRMSNIISVILCIFTTKSIIVLANLDNCSYPNTSLGKAFSKLPNRLKLIILYLPG